MNVRWKEYHKNQPEHPMEASSGPTEDSKRS